MVLKDTHRNFLLVLRPRAVPTGLQMGMGVPFSKGRSCSPPSKCAPVSSVTRSPKISSSANGDMNLCGVYEAPEGYCIWYVTCTEIVASRMPYKDTNTIRDADEYRVYQEIHVRFPVSGETFKRIVTGRSQHFCECSEKENIVVQTLNRCKNMYQARGFISQR